MERKKRQLAEKEESAGKQSSEDGLGAATKRIRQTDTAHLARQRFLFFF